MQETNNWIKNPTKKQMTLVVILGLAGFILLLLSMTNFFSETIFQGKYLVLYFLLIGSGLTVYKVCRNYYKTNK
jgi:hypothetical protein